MLSKRLGIPIDGIVKSVNNQSGDAANSSYDGSDSSDAFITLVQSGAYRVKGRINELNRNEYREGQTVTIRSVPSGQTVTLTAPATTP